jgi:hypothetical protein
MLAIDFKRKFLKDDTVKKMAVLAVRKNNGFDYWFHVQDHHELPDDSEYDILLTRV